MHLSRFETVLRWDGFSFVGVVGVVFEEAVEIGALALRHHALGLSLLGGLKICELARLLEHFTKFKL